MIIELIIGVISWLIFSIIIAIVGSKRMIGATGAFFLSLFLSPLIGMFLTLSSKSKFDFDYEQGLLEIQKKQLQILESLYLRDKGDRSDDTLKIKDLLDKDLISDDENKNYYKRILIDGDIQMKGKEQIKQNHPNYSEVEIGSESSYMFGEMKFYKIEFEDGIKGDLYFIVNSETWKVNYRSGKSGFFQSKEAAITEIYSSVDN